MSESSPGAVSQIESAPDVNVANLSGVCCDRPGSADTRLFLSERSLWRPKIRLCQIYMIFDRHHVGVINLKSDRNVAVIHTIVTVCLLRPHQTGYQSKLRKVLFAISLIE